jgi:hypothetical protein
VMSCYVVWKFSENIAGAKQLLIDYTTNFKQAFLAGQFYDFPSFPKTVPDLKQIIAKDKSADVTRGAGCTLRFKRKATGNWRETIVGYGPGRSVASGLARFASREYHATLGARGGQRSVGCEA